MKRVFVDETAKLWNGQGVLSIVGPTATGKTALALSLYQKFRTQRPLLVSVDSVAMYQGFDIGSAKPTSLEREGVEWSGIDLFSPKQVIHVAGFLEAIKSNLQQALLQKRPVILVGGSHFYERALVDGMSPGKTSDAQYIESLKEKSNQDLYNWILSFDQRWSQKLLPTDRYRLERHLDLIDRQGFSYDELQSESQRTSLLSPYVNEVTTCCLGLNLSAELLEVRQKTRIDQMFALGWMQEVQELLNQGIDPMNSALQSVGYREITSYLAKKDLNFEQLKENIFISHRQLAKKQRTWLRGLINKSNV